MLIEVTLGLLLILIVYVFFKKDPEPLLGIYSQPGKWYHLKRALFFVFLTLRKYQMDRIKKKGTPSSELGDAGLGMKSKMTVDEMDCVQKLADNPLAIDCTYFNGLNANGDYILLRLARRHNREAEIWLYINIEGVGFFQHPVHPDTTLYNIDSNSYNAGGLRFECLEPMRRWKVTFNGMLRKGMCDVWPQENKEMVHVKFSFMWNAFTDPYDFDTDIYPGCLASSIARETWSKEYFDKLKKSHQTHYEQWGELLGIVQVEGHEDKQLTLRGYRDHSYGVRDWYTFHRYAINFAYLEDGTAFHVSSLSMPGLFSLLQCGYMSKPNAEMHAIRSTDMNMIDLGENQNPPSEYEFNYTADGKTHHVKVKARTVIKFYLHDDWRSVIYEQVSDYWVDGVKGYGIFEFLYRNPCRSPVHREEMVPLLTEPEISPHNSSVLWLPFAARDCGSSRLVGGKGCQLALLTQLSSTKFSVPPGFCLTLSAFDLQVTKTPALRDAISLVEKISCTDNFSHDLLKSACGEAVAAFRQAPICPEVQDAVVAALVEIFGSEYSSRLLAVRSSAAGEDGSEMSAAGQMETVLGVSGLDKIYDAIRYCWSSLFSYTPVAYRRQNGQLVTSSAGVVIQEMVPAKAAGVLFTRHPVTGNPGEMMINANYGLGESVVSGEAEPDQVTITRSWTDEVAIKTKEIGSKKRCMTLTASGVEAGDTGGQGNDCCLDDEIILQLAAIGIELEKRFSDPRDIEFAIDEKNRIHLLQARPITTLDIDSEWHLLHEFDGPLANDREYLTTANIQEMMPGVMTPLTISSFLNVIDRSIQIMMTSTGVQSCMHYPTKVVVVRCNQGFINLNYVYGMYEGRNAIAQKRMGELSIVGEVLNKPTMEEVISYHGKLPRWKCIWNGIQHIWVILNSAKATKHYDEKLKTYTIVDRPWKSAQELYAAISADLPVLEQMWAHHVICSGSSGIWSNVLMAVISQNGNVWKTEHYSDLAMLLSKCEDVYSGDVPALIMKLAENVKTEEEQSKMINSTPEEALDWLRSKSSGQIGQEFMNFLSRHGHRCIREAEFREKSWHMEPTKVVKVLQSMVKENQKKASGFGKVNSSEPSISKLKSETTFFARLVLRYMWPKARRGVGRRETSKNVSVKMADVFKQAYWKLADIMIKESRIPDKDLLFFFTHREIGQLLESRSARMITRAQRRRQILSQQALLRFPRINCGHPIPIDMSTEGKTFSSMLKVSGLPVSQGVVRGTARVVKSVSEATAIQNGEILVVEYTDVGWSPYFPMISGLVTEIGGLLSHGAVVAREYGLPCIVNVTHATQIFQSGDKVILNATAGTMEKISEKSANSYDLM